MTSFLFFQLLSRFLKKLTGSATLGFFFPSAPRRVVNKKSETRSGGGCMRFRVWGFSWRGVG